MLRRVDLADVADDVPDREDIVGEEVFECMRIGLVGVAIVGWLLGSWVSGLFVDFKTWAYVLLAELLRDEP